MEEDNHSSADEFEHVEATGVDDQVVEPTANSIEILRSEFRAEMDAMKTEDKLLAARLEIVEQKLNVAEVEAANQTKWEIPDEKSKKQSNDVEQEKQRNISEQQMVEMKSEAKLEQITEHLDQQGLADFGGKMAALESESLAIVEKMAALKSQIHVSMENQVLSAMGIYLEQPRTMEAVLKKSCELYKDGSDLHRHSEALDLVLRAMEMHLGDEDVQIAGISSIFTIKRKVEMNQDTKERVIQAFINAMEKHLDSLPLVQKCCSGLRYQVPQDVLFAFDRVAKLLLKVLEKHESYADTVVSHLNSMTRHADGKEKSEVGETGAIEIMLQQIERKLQANTYGYAMEDCWSFLWNVMNGNPANCERFLKAAGMTLFNQCYAKFGDKNTELLRKMMGTIWKFAVMPQFRDQLLTNAYLEIFCAFLDNLNKGIEVSFISAGVLANLLVNDECWTKSDVTLSRDHVNMLIVKAAEKWDLKTHLSIAYTSFNFIFPLLSQWHSIGSQHWALWTLANLTTIRDKQKYCRLITEEKGMELLEQLKTDSRSTDGIRQLACIVIKNVEDWKKNPQVD